MASLMPLIRRRVFHPLFGLLSQSPKLAYWKKLEKTQCLPEAQLREIQWQRLKDILFFVWENNEFYRKRFEWIGVTPEDIRNPDELRRLPVLTKAEIRKNPLGLISRGVDVAKLQKAKTGGSTGKALELYFTEECSEFRNACALRHDRWAGWELGEPIAACWGNPQLSKTFKEKMNQQLLQPIFYLDTMSVNEASIQLFVEEWRRVRPTLLFGHAHSIFVLAQDLRKLGINDLRPEGILSTSMMLIPPERKLIEEVFDRKVIDRYGCEEVGLIGCECEQHEGMHLNIEHLFIEFLKDDDTLVGQGEPGRIVVTDLMNRAMPLIRYQVEDVGVPSDRKCSCGRGLPLMESVTGRMADFLIKQDGTRVAGVSLIENTLTSFPGLNQMQIVQHGYTHFEIRLVTDHTFSCEVSKELITYFKSVFGENVEIDLNPVVSILPEKSGKFRFSICNLNP